VPISQGLAVAAVFFVADVTYTLDHYFVHRDRKRYRATHGRHHRRYNRVKRAPQLDAYELSTYTTAGVMLVLATSTLSLYTGNWGFVAGALAKYVHSLLFHLYQHAWWRFGPATQLALGPPRAGWGLASARYHSWHHARPDVRPFTYAESWAGLDRILERIDPWLSRFAADVRRGGGRGSRAPGEAA